MIKRIIHIVRLTFFGSLFCARKEGMKVGHNVTIIGRNVNFGSEPYLITINDDVRISNNVMFITHDGGNYAFRYKDEYREVNRFGKIYVGSHTFIGANSTIMPNVKIGSNCVIGAGAVVVKSVPNNTVVAGVPAKIICSTEEYANKMKNHMPEKWNSEIYRNNKREYLLSIINDPEF